MIENRSFLTTDDPWIDDISQLESKVWIRCLDFFTFQSPILNANECKIDTHKFHWALCFSRSLDATWCHFDLTLIIWLKVLPNISSRRWLNNIVYIRADFSMRCLLVYDKRISAEKLLKEKEKKIVTALPIKSNQANNNEINSNKISHNHTVHMATQSRCLYEMPSCNTNTYNWSNKNQTVFSMVNNYSKLKSKKERKAMAAIRTWAPYQLFDLKEKLRSSSGQSNLANDIFNMTLTTTKYTEDTIQSSLCRFHLPFWHF